MHRFNRRHLLASLLLLVLGGSSCIVPTHRGGYSRRSPSITLGHGSNPGHSTYRNGPYPAPPVNLPHGGGH